MRSVARERASGSQGCGHITSPSPGLQGPHGQAAWPTGAEVEAAPAHRVLVAPLALRDGAPGAAVALEAGVVPAVLLQELLGRRLPGHRGGLVPGASRARLPVNMSVPAVRGGFQLGVVLRSNLESGSQGSEEEEEDGGSTSALEPGQAVAERQRCGDAMLERLEALEADVRFLCTELGAEKLLWSSRFLELLREQQGLRQRLQERPRRWDSGDSPELLGEAEDQSASGSEGESLAGRRWMEPRWQPAPCPGSLLGPAASRQAENVSKGVSGVLVRREGATCPSLPRHCRTQGRTAQSWLCSHVLVCASILQCQPGPAPSCPILPSPAHSAELQPVPRSRNQPGGSSGQAAVSWAAQGRSQSPLARGHPWD
ncbi:uncharacterized protein LOC128152655 isoform X5 [Harpia harpyja]|uniref:uncharacterized protein LOC128152655 isoform X5 n=1 Tax=Harpia harpyja TaxID=202280 RepID=UPI0022B0CEF0|nr:uncharacterized protein LOC128152655 isoform X5 [Harpia harpyja]